MTIPRMERHNGPTSFPLSASQEQLWYLNQLAPGSPVYNVVDLIDLGATYDPEVLRKVAAELVRRHETLRTAFSCVSGQPTQVVLPTAELELLESDLTSLPETEQESEWTRIVHEQTRRPFDLSQAPLIRWTVIHRSGEEHKMLVVIDHIITDEWGTGILHKEVIQLYEDFSRGQASSLDELPIQYADFACWQRDRLQEEVLRRQLAYWKDELAGAPQVLELTTDKSRPAIQSFRGAWETFQLPLRVLDPLKALCRQERSTLFMTLLAGFMALLYRYTGQEDILVGTPISLRRLSETESLVGYFLNTVVLRSQFREGLSFRSLLQQVRKRMLGAIANAELPFNHLVAELAPERNLSRTPLFQVAFVLHDRNGVSEISRASSRSQLGTGSSKFDLSLFVSETNNGLDVSIEYSTDLFEPQTIRRIGKHFGTLLEAIGSNPDESVSKLNLLTGAERRHLLYELNDTKAEYPSDKCVHQLFEEQAARTPNAVAAVFEDATLSYAELNQRANQLAHYLRDMGVKPDVPVGICTERSFETIVAFLAVLKAGGAYLPLDPDYPVERLRFMLQDSQPIALLTQSHLAGIFAEVDHALPVLLLDSAVPQWASQPTSNPSSAAVGLNPLHLAYIIYTSGSTGQPKGVMVPHRAINRLVVNSGYATIRPGDRIAFAANPAFDASTLEVWAPLLNGGCIVVIAQSALLDPVQLSAILRSQNISLMWLTVGLFNQYADVLAKDFASLRYLMVGGDALNVGVIARVLQNGPPRHLLNGYGPTETTTFATTYEITAVGEDTRSIPIGRPIANTTTYILDALGEPVPVGVSGELYIGGAGVARGYLNRPELTAERFLPDPFASEPGARMYRTGDLARWLSDGNIEFLGRNDFQVKIRGFRIELGEIEARLAEHPAVREAVVVAREDTPGDKRLVAYYTASLIDESEEGTVGAEQFRSYLSVSLPVYMVPSAYVRMESLPLTPNGKLDRKALPVPEADACSSREYEPPIGEAETKLAAIWAEVLKLDRVGRHDNFFSLGGHSLMAVTLVERMRREGFEADARSLFLTPTLAQLAAAIDGDAPRIEVPPNRIPLDARTITPEMLPLVKLSQEEIDGIVNSVPGGVANVKDIYPIAPLQEGILFHYLMGGAGDPYLLTLQLSFDNRDRLDAYVSALQAVIDRHDILRTGVMWEGLPEPVQVVRRKAFLHIEEIELDAAAGDAAEQLIARFSPRRFRIDVRQAPLLRLYLANDKKNDQWVVLILLHHIAGDHTTLDVMQTEIQAHLLGKGEQLSAPLPFRNLIAQARLGVSQQKHEAFFRQMLGDVDEPTTPFGLLNVQGDGSDIVEAHLDLDGALSRLLRTNARRLGVSAASLFHLAWARVLANTTGKEDVVFGTVLFGRMQGGEGADRIMGLFINTLPVRISAGNDGVEASVRRTHALLADLMRHEHASLALAQRCSTVVPPTPLFSALLNYRYGARPDEFPSADAVLAWQGIRRLGIQERTNYPLVLSVNDLGDGFSLDVQTLATIGPARVCEFMRTALESLTEALEASPTKPVRTLDALPAFERQHVLNELNDTKADFPRDKCVHELFEEQVARTPDAVAVVFEDQKISYAELNRRANRLAHYLQELGVRPDARVAVCVERSFEMVVALMAVLKAGGAYVPLDPSYPPERLRFMLEDSQPVALLMQRHLGNLFEGVDNKLPVLDLTETAPLWNSQPESNPDLKIMGLMPHHLAYVIYTSGSTGNPKGVLVHHRGVVNRMAWMQHAYDLQPSEAVLQKTPFGFDVSVWEFFWTLQTGARLVMARPEGHKDPAYLVDTIRKNKITTMHFVPSMLQVFLEHEDLSDIPSLVRVVCSGEALPAALLQRFQERIPHAELHNLYGPTEAAVDVTAWTAPAHFSDSIVPIGKPVWNTQMYILDGHGEPVPMGVTGELYIGGVQVARGYLNRPELTAERFVADPFSAEPGARMYRTGDLARFLADGNIEYLGRNDFQVKIRGFRIELGEIEARLAEHPAVWEAVVVAREDTVGDKRLVAYYTASPAGESEETAVGAEQFRAHLSASLPEYMVPAAYVRLEQLPLSPNGKLDRKALPKPKADTFSTSGYEPPQGEMETKLAAIWAEVLKLDRVGRHDNFFDLGGHSLLAVQLISRLQQVIPGKPLPLRVLLEAPTVERIAVWIQNHEGSDQKVLVRIRPGTSARPPFFCVHASDGTAVGMRPLAMAMDADLPFYCLQAKGLDGSKPFDSVEEAARYYLDEIRKVQPHGPYYLGGYCFGGMVAFEMARMLEQLNEPVAPLILIDSFNPAYLRFIPTGEMVLRYMTYFVRRTRQHVHNILSLRLKAWFHYIGGLFGATLVHLQRFKKRLSKKERSRIPPGPSQAEIDSSRTGLEEILSRLMGVGPSASRKFVPKPYGGGAVVYRVNERNYDPFEDYYLGWKPVILGAMESFEIEATHEDILRDPAVRVMAEMIDAKLRESAVLMEEESAVYASTS